METNLRAERFAVLKAQTECHQCHAQTPVSTLMVPAYVEFDGEEWIRSDGSALLIYIEVVDASTQQAWSERAPWMRPTASNTAGFTYLANVCSCGALQGDYFLTKPHGPFFPLDDVGIAAIDVEWIEARMEALAGTCQSSWTDRLIELFPYAGWAPPLPRKQRRVRRRP